MKQQLYQQYVTALRRALPVMLLASAVASLIAYGLVVRAGESYTLHFSYVVSLVEREEPTEYTFDGYYALQATDLFAASLARWVTAPEIIAAAFAATDQQQPADVRVLSQAVRAEKTAPQLVQVSVRGASVAEVEAIADALRIEIARSIAQYHDEGIPALQFRAVPTQQWVGQQAIATHVVVVATFVVFFLLAANAVILRESLREL